MSQYRSSKDRANDEAGHDKVIVDPYRDREKAELAERLAADDAEYKRRAAKRRTQRQAIADEVNAQNAGRPYWVPLRAATVDDRSRWFADHGERGAPAPERWAANSQPLSTFERGRHDG